MRLNVEYSYLAGNTSFKFRILIIWRETVHLNVEYISVTPSTLLLFSSYPRILSSLVRWVLVVKVIRRVLTTHRNIAHLCDNYKKSTHTPIRSVAPWLSKWSDVFGHSSDISSAYAAAVKSQHILQSGQLSTGCRSDQTCFDYSLKYRPPMQHL